MELDQEKQNQEAAERCRALAQRIVRELAPRSVQVLEDSGLLEKAFCKMNTAVVQSAPELLVVADPQWVTLPAVQAEKSAAGVRRVRRHGRLRKAACRAGLLPGACVEGPRRQGAADGAVLPHGCSGAAGT